MSAPAQTAKMEVRLFIAFLQFPKRQASPCPSIERNPIDQRCLCGAERTDALNLRSSASMLAEWFIILLVDVGAINTATSVPAGGQATL